MSQQMLHLHTDDLVDNILINTKNILVIYGYDEDGNKIKGDVCIYVRFHYRAKNAPLRMETMRINKLLGENNSYDLIMYVLEAYKEFRDECDEKYTDWYKTHHPSEIFKEESK